MHVFESGESKIDQFSQHYFKLYLSLVSFPVRYFARFIYYQGFGNKAAKSHVSRYAVAHLGAAHVVIINNMYNYTNKLATSEWIFIRTKFLMHKTCVTSQFPRLSLARFFREGKYAI